MGDSDGMDSSLLSLPSTESTGLRLESETPDRQKVSPTPSKYLTSLLPWPAAGVVS